MPHDETDDAPIEGLALEHIFGDRRPFAQCHASTLVGVPSERFLVAWFGGTHEAHPDVGIWAARRARAPFEASPSPGVHWSEPRQIAKVSDEAHWNPVLFPLSDDGAELVLHWKVGERIRHWRTWSARSHDGGETWVDHRPLVDDPREARGGRGAVRNKPIRLDSGAWLAGASLERWRRWDVFFDRSEDGERDWQRTPLVRIDRRTFRGKGLIQPTLWESEPGRVHALFRSTDGRTHRADSEDDGRSWSAAYPTDLPNNNSGLDLARLPDGVLALACNPVPGNWAARTPLSILFSHDNGLTWPARIDLETEAGEFSYPAIIPSRDPCGDPDGLSVTYTWNRRRIAFARISASAIAAATLGAGV